MFRNCLASAWRSARHDGFYALLNIFGLALGFAAVILIWLFVRDELSYNRFLPGYQDVSRLQLTMAEAGQRPVTWSTTPERMAAELKLDFPEIVATTRDAIDSVALRHGAVEATETVDWVDSDFFTVLGYRLLQGDPATALAEPDSIVLTQSLAEKYFGGINCLGQTLDVNRIHPIRVTGIAEDPPTNSTLRFVALLSGKTGYGSLAALDATRPVPGQLNATVETYVRLKPGVPADRLAARFPAFILAHYPSIDGSKPLFASLYMNPLAALHLHPFNPDTTESSGRVQTLYAVGATGLLILLLAGINFVNLVTARGATRAVEVGVRKALGARRSQLMAQFIGESLAYAMVGAVIGTALAALSLPSLNVFLDRKIAFDLPGQPLLAVALLSTAALFGIVAGLYPAVILSSVPPALVLKSRAGLSTGGGKMRLGLVVCQFTVTIALLIATHVIYRQNTFATSKALGFDKDLVLTIDLTGMPRQETTDGFGRREATPVEALRTQLAGVPGVQAIAATFVVPPLTKSLLQDFSLAGPSSHPRGSFNIQPIDFGYFDLYRVPLLAGRDFSRGIVEDKAAPEDKARLSGAVINQAAVRALGFVDASAAIGREIHSANPDDPERHHRIIGVAADFSLDSIRNRVQPTVFIVDPDLFNVLSVKLSGSDLVETLRGIDAVWHEFVPERPVDRVFLDDRISVLYRDISRQGSLFASFAGFAVVIGCLGLIGLSAYTAERRTKEIGIRKTLGASTLDVTRLLIWQLVKPVLMANALAWPIAWWFMRGWLDGFAYRVDLGPGPFLAAGFGAVAIAIATTAFHALRVAQARPITALRYE